MSVPKILIVDDNTIINEMYKEYFESCGCSAEIACNGQEGVVKYCAVKPDVVVMDMQMPVMNGYESSKSIKGYDPNAKILMVTGYPEDPLAAQSLREGYVRSVIPKPCNLNNLFQTIRDLLAA